MNTAEAPTRFRIARIRPWEVEGADDAPTPIRTFFEGKEGDADDLRALVVSFGGLIESLVNNGERHQAVLLWRGHHYDLDLEALS